MGHDKLSTKEQILVEAMRLFHTKGFRGTSLSDVLAAAGIQKGSLYFHFPSKRDLGLSVLERARVEFVGFLGEAISGETPEVRLHNFLDTVLATHGRMGFVGGCLWGNTALEMSDNDDEFAGFVARVFQEWTQLIEAVIDDGQKAGQFRADLPASQLAAHVVASIEGGIMQSRLKKDESPLKICIEAIKQLMRGDGGGGADRKRTSITDRSTPPGSPRSTSPRTIPA